MCGSRTGGWSLPGVMSDWQRGVDWLLAKYCRCRLQLDWCWCRWRTSAEGHCRWGLQVWRRQVGLVQGTQCLVESSVGHMVARTTGRSHIRFLGWASKPRSSRDYVENKSWVAISAGYTEFAGFTRKPLDYSVDPRNWGWRLDEEVRPPRLVQPPRGRSDRPGRCRREASKRRTRVGIARLVSRLSKGAVIGHPSDGEKSKTSKSALEGHVSLVI
jgi:hypothetical protein